MPSLGLAVHRSLRSGRTGQTLLIATVYRHSHASAIIALGDGLRLPWGRRSLGTHTLTSSSVYFDNVRIEPEEIIGTEHMAWVELWDVLNTERLVTSAAAIGSARLALRLGLDYTSQRKVFGDVPIAAYQGVQFPFAEAHAMLSCAREMNFKAAWLCDERRNYGSEANTAKYLAAEALAKATERSMHSMGGMGFSREMHVERLWRDARLSQFAPVPQEMILNFIAQHDLGMPRSY